LLEGRIAGEAPRKVSPLGQFEVCRALVSETRCALGQIDALDATARADAATKPLLDSSKLGSIFWMHSANWSLATGSGTLGHFPIEEQLAFAALYDGIVHRQITIEQISDQMDQVDTRLPLASDVQGRRELRAALGALKVKFVHLVSDEDYMRRRFDALGVKPDRSDFAADVPDAGHCAH
jgi:hypothetical protein